MSVGLYKNNSFSAGSNKLFADFNFNNLDNYEKYEMDNGTAQSIQNTLRNHITPPEDDVILKTEWETAMGGDYGNQAVRLQTIKTMAEIFKECEVIPYIFRIPEISLKQNQCHSAIHGPFGWFPGASFPAITSDNLYNSEKTTNTLIYSGNRTTKEGQTKSVNGGYLWFPYEKTNGTLYDNTSILYNMKFSKSGKVVGTVEYPDISKLQNTDKWYAKKIDDNEISQVYGFNVEDTSLTEFKRKYSSWKKVSSLTFYDNTNDGTYTKSNPRKTSGFVENAEGKQIKGKSLLVFFVKIKTPFVNADGTTDGTMPTESYVCFNFLSLLTQHGIGSDNNTFFNAFPDLVSYEDTFFSNFYTIEDIDKFVINVQPTYLYYIPFSYFLKQDTSFFDDCELFVSSYTNTVNNPTQSGSFILSPDGKAFERFFRANGIPVSNDKNEVLYKNTDDWTQVSGAPAPGSGGYAPEIGGGSYGDRPDDAITGAQNNTSQAFLNSSYILNKLNVKRLQEALINTDFSVFLKTIFQNDPAQGIISLMSFPINFDNLVSAEETDVVVVGCNLSEKSSTGSVKGKKVDAMKTRFYLGEFYIKEGYHSFADYNATNISIYFPFCGFSTLPTEMVMGRKIRIYFDLDYSDGSIMYVVYCANNRGDNPSGFFPLQTQNGQCGTTIPLSQAHSRDANQAKLNAALKVGVAAAGAATGNVGALALAGAGAIDTAANAKPQYTAPSSIASGSHAYAISDPNQCFIVISYPRANIPSQYGSFNGFPTQITDKLGNYKGFTQCDSTVRVEIPATENEKDMIKSFLVNGIVIQ